MTTQVKGFVGLLEVEDQLHETPTTTVNFGNAKGSSCDSYSFLLEAIESKDVQETRQNLCDISDTHYQDHVPDKFMPVLLGLGHSQDAQTRMCAGGAMVAMTRALNSMDAAAAEAILNVLANGLADPDNESRIRASEYLRDFARDIRLRLSRQGGTHDLTASAFLPILIKMLMEPDNSNAYEQRQAALSGRMAALHVLSTLGSMASDALPALLDAANPNDEILYALVAIAPKDPRVANNIRLAAARGNDTAVQILKNSH